MASFCEFLGGVIKALNEADEARRKDEIAERTLNKFRVRLGKQDILGLLSKAGATEEELDAVKNYIPGKEIYVKFDRGEEVERCSSQNGSEPRYLGECDGTVRDGSHNNLVRLSNGKKVVAQPGDCTTWSIWTYRWNGTQWRRLD